MTQKIEESAVEAAGAENVDTTQEPIPGNMDDHNELLNSLFF